MQGAFASSTVKKKTTKFNTSNLSDALSMLHQKKVDILCLQEAGSCPWSDLTNKTVNGIKFQVGTVQAGTSSRKKHIGLFGFVQRQINLDLIIDAVWR